MQTSLGSVHVTLICALCQAEGVAHDAGAGDAVKERAFGPPYLPPVTGCLSLWATAVPDKADDCIFRFTE